MSRKMLARALALGIVLLDGATFGRIIRDGLAKWERVVKERNIKVA